MSEIYYDPTPYNDAAAGFGIETDFGASGDQFKQLGYQEDAWTDILKLAGLYPEDLLGLAPAPEMPTAQPYQSDLVASMGNNPLMAEIAGMIGQGVDPQAAAEAAIIAAQEAQEGDPLYGAGAGLKSSDIERLATTGMTYATELERQNREQGAYDQELSAYENYAVPQALDARPEGDQITDLIEQYGIQRLRPDFVDPRLAEIEAAKARGQAGRNDPAYMQGVTTELGNRMMDDPQTTQALQPSVERYEHNVAAQAAPPPMDLNLAGYQEPVLGGVAGSTSTQGPIQNDTGLQSAAAPPAQTGGNGGQFNIGRLIEDYASQVAPQTGGLNYNNLDKSDQQTYQILQEVAKVRQNTMMPSQQEQDNRDRMAQMYTMVTGNPLPQAGGGYTPPPVVERIRSKRL